MIRTGLAPLPLSAASMRAGGQSPLPLAAPEYWPPALSHLCWAGLPAGGLKVLGIAPRLPSHSCQLLPTTGLSAGWSPGAQCGLSHIPSTPTSTPSQTSLLFMLCVFPKLKQYSGDSAKLYNTEYSCKWLITSEWSHVDSKETGKRWQCTGRV